MSEVQERFTQDVARLILQAQVLGYTLTFGEAYRTPEQALLNAQAGIGIVHSLHTYRLAIDLNVFKGGLWMKNGNDFADLGQWWEALSPRHCWGQRFSKPDGNHWSISPDGITK